MFRRKRTEDAANGRRHRIRKLRLLLVLLILALLACASFASGMVTAIAGQIPSCDPGHVPREVDGHIYADDDHTILATLRGSQSRILVTTDEIAPVLGRMATSAADGPEGSLSTDSIA